MKYSKECDSNCGSYQLYLMITSGKPYCYSGPIPCLNCSRYSFIKDNYTPTQTEQKIILNESKDA